MLKNYCIDKYWKILARENFFLKVRGKKKEEKEQ
jgi:hypothetical protein